MILLVDQGNTRSKWRLLGLDAQRSGDKEFQEGTIEFSAGAAGFEAGVGFSLPNMSGIEKILIASVAEQSAQEALVHILQKAMPAARNNSGEAPATPKVIKIRTLQNFLDLQLAYSEVDDLGVDRWLQLLVAHHSAEYPALVISAGTALVVDKLDGNGRHMGGQIAPGWRMLTEVVQNRTARISDRLPSGFADQSLGDGTRACLHAGVSLMAKAFVASINETLAPDCRSIWLCGGDAHLFTSVLPAAEIKPNLVLDGLALVAQHFSEYSQLSSDEE